MNIKDGYRAQYFLDSLIVSPEQYLDLRDRLAVSMNHTATTEKWLLDIGQEPSKFRYKQTKIRVDWESVVMDN